MDPVFQVAFFLTMVMANSNDEELHEMVIRADDYDYEVDEQYIEK